jgi:hypothetical protein
VDGIINGDGQMMGRVMTVVLMLTLLRPAHSRPHLHGGRAGQEPPRARQGLPRHARRCDSFQPGLICFDHLGTSTDIGPDSIVPRRSLCVGLYATPSHLVVHGMIPPQGGLRTAFVFSTKSCIHVPSDPEAAVTMLTWTRTPSNHRPRGPRRRTVDVLQGGRGHARRARAARGCPRAREYHGR